MGWWLETHKHLKWYICHVKEKHRSFRNSGIFCCFLPFLRYTLVKEAKIFYIFTFQQSWSLPWSICVVLYHTVKADFEPLTLFITINIFKTELQDEMGITINTDIRFLLYIFCYKNWKGTLWRHISERTTPYKPFPCWYRNLFQHWCL